MTETPLDPTRTALLAMDLQPGILQRLEDADRLLDAVQRAVGAARTHGAHVGWVRVGFTDADVEAVPPTSPMAAVVTPERRAAVHADAPAMQVHPRLEPQPHDVTVRKTRVGAFTTTDLHDQLRGRGVDTLVLTGISTSGVVLSTVREAMDRDYRIVVLRDGCADPDGEVHDFLTARIFPRYATVIAADELDGLWA